MATALSPLTTVPGCFGSGGQSLIANEPDLLGDAPVSWNAGLLYDILPNLAVYAGGFVGEPLGVFFNLHAHI